MNKNNNKNNHMSYYYNMATNRGHSGTDGGGDEGDRMWEYVGDQFSKVLRSDNKKGTLLIANGAIKIPLL